VTIDLNGFTIKGVAGSVAGVSGAGKDRVKVFNGRIVGMSTGINILPSTINHQAIVLEDIVISQSTNIGVNIGAGSLFNCQIVRSGNIGAFLSANTTSTVEGCTFYDNGSDGLNMYSGTVRNSSASSNNGTGFSVTTGTVVGCTAADNFVGIIIEAGVVKDSTVQDNRDLGIRANGNALISNNSISNNTFIDQSIGIQVQNTSGTRIEGNAITRMYVGVSLLTGNNYAVSNSFRGCTHAFNVAANNRIGTLVTATASPMFIGNVGGGLGTTDPYANILH
jgi:parallel beta-helix repeat protein